MKAAYVTAYDLSNVRKVNGAGKYIAECLSEQSISLEFIDLRHAPVVYLMRGLLKSKEQLHKRLGKTIYAPMRSQILARVYAYQLAARLKQSDADSIFSPICPGSLPISYLNTTKPMFIWTDATFAGLLNFYPGFTNLAPQTIRDGLANERAALERCRLAIFSSEWAARTAIEHHGISPDRVRVVPFGPYTHDLPSPREVRQLIDARSGEARRCKLLFLGRDWQRKGGDIAIETVQTLRDLGVEAELTIAGCYPPLGTPLPAYIHTLGFLSKSNPEHRRALVRLFAESHFLIVPSRADCAPAVVREASAYGLPCVTTDVGGLSTIIRNGKNGRTFALEDRAPAYAAYIAEIFRDPRGYHQLGLTTAEEYRLRLSWKSSGLAVKQLFTEALSERAPLESQNFAPLT